MRHSARCFTLVLFPFLEEIVVNHIAAIQVTGEEVQNAFIIILKSTHTVLCSVVTPVTVYLNQYQGYAVGLIGILTCLNYKLTFYLISIGNLNLLILLEIIDEILRAGDLDH